MKKVAACKVKLYELVHRDNGDLSGNKMDQGEKDDEEKVDLKDNKENDELIENTLDSEGAFYMRIDNDKCFNKSSVFVVELQYLNTKDQKLWR